MRRATDFDSTVLPSWLQSQHPQGFWHNHLLLPVVWRGDTLKQLEAVQGSGTTCALVGGHTTDSTEEDLRGGTVMERSRFFRVHNMAFVEEVVIAKLVWNKGQLL